MATLAGTSNIVRKGIVFFGVFSVVVIVLGTIFQGSQAVLEEDNEINRLYMEIDRALGEVPSPTLEGIQYNPNANFQIESVLPEFPDASYIYSINRPRGLLSFDVPRKVATDLGFNLNTERTAGNTLTWTSTETVRTLTFDTVEQIWELKTNLQDSPTVVGTKTLLNSAQAYINTTGQVISRLGFDTTGLGGSSTIEIVLAKLQNDFSFIDTTFIEQAEYIFTNAFRVLDLADPKPGATSSTGGTRLTVVKGKVYSKDPRFGQVEIVGTNQLRNLAEDILELKFTNFTYGIKGSYPIITPEEAWSNVQQGQGALVQIRRQGENYFTKPDSIEVRRFIADAQQTELAFFEDVVWTGFVTPIYVFRGRAELNDGRIATFIFFTDGIKRL